MSNEDMEDISSVTCDTLNPVLDSQINHSDASICADGDLIVSNLICLPCPGGRDLINICSDAKDCASNDVINKVARHFPSVASLRLTPLSIRDTLSFSFILRRLSCLSWLGLEDCNLKSDTFCLIAEAIKEMPGWVGKMNISYNYLSSSDIDNICAILDKVHTMLDMRNCFCIEGYRGWRDANSEEKRKIQSKLNLLDNWDLRVYVDSSHIDDKAPMWKVNQHRTRQTGQGIKARMEAFTMSDN